ncbi:phage tail tape measure protein, TP901 family, core region [Serratia liquefaciens]|uniref:phage tail tape measure protein n=1 Tax=Serratia liquefaciens TaxID=614 RepID=UPI00217C624D|nr:phage tail tape measure protein [Serratia liquefaciens]CAI0716659.1 phage tail tape measure protein, TP901 family, core region [Serratia liquefaciens]CAI1716468.1 phage tail tape measure protein, TP901 family, core region [Serratia liquefaciens]
MDLSIRVAFSAIDKLTRPVNAASKAVGGLSDSLKKTQSAVKDLDKQAASFDRLRTQANDTAQKINRAKREFNGLNQTVREGGQLTDAQAAHLENLRGKLSRLTQTYSLQTAKLREASQAVRQHGVNLNAGSGAIQSAIRRTEQYNQQLERERQRLAAVTQAQARYSRAKETGSKLRGDGMGMALGAGAAGYAGGTFLAPAVGFDEEMSRVQALTRLDKSSSQLADLRAQAKKLGAETAFTTRDAASGQAFLAMAGFTPQSIQAALPGVLNMALAGGMELGESADIGSNILSQFTLPAGEMDRVSDVLTAAFTRTNTDLRNLGDTMKYAGPVASKLGISLEEAAGMAGILANNGLRGSDAGTAMRASLARLASPPKAAAKALKELGVSVADASGKMRPAETILLDLYNATKKYGQVDQVGFFKDIAGEEAFVGLQTLVAGAGSGALQKLIGELKKAAGESAAVAKTMADNLGGDLKNLDSAWEGFRIQVEETADGPLRKLTQGLSDAITATSEWVKENPRLAQTTLLVAGGLIALVAALGIASIATGLLIGPLAKLHLGFTLLTGGRGLLGTISALRGFVGAGGNAMARMSGWSRILASLSGGFRGLLGSLAPLRSMLMGAFMSPAAALGSLTRGVAGLVLRLSGLPAIWGLITGAISVLGGVLSFLLSPIGLVGAAFVAAGVLIWRYWEPIKAFFVGFGVGVMEALAPLRDAFARITPIFGVIGDAIGRVCDWFTKLLSPMQTSKETLEKCTSAGETFGRVFGTALQVLLYPLSKLMDGVGWLLEKMGLIPDGIEQARRKAESLRNQPVMWEWDPQQKKMVKKGWNWTGPGLPTGAATVDPKLGAPPPVLTGDTGTQRRLNEIAGSTKATADNTKAATKRIGPGDIVFKNLPQALALRGAYQEARVMPQPVPRLAAAAGGVLSVPSATQPAAMAPVSAPGGGAPIFQLNFNDVGKRSDQELERMVRNAVRDAMASTAKGNRGSFRDRD